MMGKRLSQQQQPEAVSEQSAGTVIRARRLPLVKPTHPLEREAKREGEMLSKTGRGHTRRGGRSRDLLALFDDLRSAAEARYGRDLSKVSLSQSSTSQNAAANVSAHAFTIKNHIHMGSTGPQTETGQFETAAHEMVHAVQQTGGANGPHPISTAPEAIARQEKKSKQPLIVDPALEKVLKDNAIMVEPEQKNDPYVFVIPGSADPQYIKDYIAKQKQDNPFMVPAWSEIQVQPPLLPMPGAETSIFITAFPRISLPSTPAKQEKKSKPRRRKTVAEKAYYKFSQQRSGYAKDLGVEEPAQVTNAIQLGVLDRYPGVFSEAELNDISNVRGLGRKKAIKMHVNAQWNIWSQCYKNLDAALRESGAQPGTTQYKEIVRKYIESYRDGMDYQFGEFYTNNPHPESGAFLKTREGQSMRAWSNRLFMKKGMSPKQMPDFAMTPWESGFDQKDKARYRPIYNPKNGDLIGYFYENLGYWEARLRNGKVVKTGETPLIPILGDEALKSAIEAVVGFIPYLGEAQDFNDATTGVSITGQKLDMFDRSLAGVALFLPFVGAGTLRSVDDLVEVVDIATDLARATGRSVDEIQDIFRVAGHLDPGEAKALGRIVDNMTDLKKITASEVKILNGLAKKLEKPLAKLAEAKKIGDKIPIRRSKVDASGKRLIKGTDKHKMQRWIEHQLRHPGRYKGISNKIDPAWEKKYWTGLKNQEAGSLFEKDVIEWLGRSSDELAGLQKNTAEMVSQHSDIPNFIPDGIKGNQAKLTWGESYHFVEIKGWADMSHTGNLKAMIQYVEKYGGHIDIVFRSAKHADGMTNITGPMQRVLWDLIAAGKATVRRYP